GRAVHVVTVNDYLARRDAAYCAPIYEALGLSVGLVAEGQTPRQRREAYAADIVYCTNKDLAFDYLRDRMALGRHDGYLRLKVERLARRNDRTDGLLLRGLDFAIVDEADSVLVDEARTPLILSAERESAVDAETADTALSFAREMQPGRDFRLRLDERRVELLEAGRDRIEAMSSSLGGPWANPAYREELLVQGLTALNLFQRDQHYIVRDGRIQIVDEYTGRILADRHWSEGLHQIVERKEGCEISGRRVTIARMTYQRLFARYRRLAGMTGTAREAAGEFWQVYRLGVVRIPTHRPPQRRMAPDRVFGTAEAKWTAIVTRVRELHAAGRPVLLGTRSVAASEEAGARLAAAGLPHVILNARHDENEADIVAEAGHRGRITVATNMAGRGTDIALGEGVPALGGLHVIMSERHDSSRIDRQLAGRCARQGEPGAFEAYLSLEDPLMEMDRSGGVRTFARLAAPLLGERAGRIAFAVTQRRIEA
ncbi:MAG: prepilin peptidase, partial [Alphaproteobacteria bacterium]